MNTAVRLRARRLAEGCADKRAVVRRSFEWVSNAIAHSIDTDADAVTRSASEVLEAGHGLCYAKSHLFATLLRANGIPAGFDYQRLADERWHGHVLHGLNTVWLEETGWLRLDPRGSAAGESRWNGGEQLVFTTEAPGELHYRLNLAQPLGVIVRLLGTRRPLVELLPELPASVPMG